MFVSPSDLSGLSGTSGGVLQRDQQQTAWERGGNVKQSYTEVLPGNFDAYGATVAQRNALDRAARERDPFKRARALEEAAAYGEEAARLKKPGAQRRPGVPVKRAVHLQQITTAEQAELQRREMQRRGVAIAQPKAVQLVAQVRQAVARILPAPTPPLPPPSRKPVYGPGSTGSIAKGGVLQAQATQPTASLPLPGASFRPSGAGLIPPTPKPTIQTQQYRMPTAARGGAVYGGGGTTGSGYAIQMGDLGTSIDANAATARGPQTIYATALENAFRSEDAAQDMMTMALSEPGVVGTARAADAERIKREAAALRAEARARIDREQLIGLVRESAHDPLSQADEAERGAKDIVAAALIYERIAANPRRTTIERAAFTANAMNMRGQAQEMMVLAGRKRQEASPVPAVALNTGAVSTTVTSVATVTKAASAASATYQPTPQNGWAAPVAILGCSAIGAWLIATSD